VNTALKADGNTSKLDMRSS